MKENNYYSALYKNYDIEEAAKFSDFEFEEVSNCHNLHKNIK